MMKSVTSWAALTLFMVCALASTSSIRYVKAWSGDMTIKSDGSVDPPTAPVSHSGNVYSLTNDVQGSITVEKDNIILDGMGHAIQWTGTSPIGIDLESRTNVTIMNVKIENFVSGVYLYSSDQNNISQTNITSNSGYGIYFYSSSNNNILGNSITANAFGVFLDSSSYNDVLENNIMSNSEGVYSTHSSNDRIYHNNLLDNTEQAHSDSSIDIWDFGYPSGGNYWNDYLGIDNKCGPSQDHHGSDGMGDTPYTIDGSNRDNYPLMNPWTPPSGNNVAVISVVSSKAVISQGFTGNITVYGANKGRYSETFNVTVYANTSTIASATVPLQSGSTTAITFSWTPTNTSFSKGNYSISANALPVPGENNTADNNFTDGWVAVAMIGDITGGTPFVPDGTVDGRDISTVAKCFGCVPGDHWWNANCDINNDGSVDGKDISIVAKHFGQSDP